MIRFEKSVMERVRLIVPRWDADAKKHVPDPFVMGFEDAVRLLGELHGAIDSNPYEDRAQGQNCERTCSGSDDIRKAQVGHP